MWGHYGDGCKGIVLEFGGNLIKNAEKVHYEEFEILPSVINSERFIKAILKSDIEETKKFAIDLLIKKHQIWDYEQEYRVIFKQNIKPDKDNNKFSDFNLNDLKGIYFGFKTEESNIEQLIQILKEKNLTHIKFYKMIRRPGYFHAKHQEIV